MKHLKQAEQKCSDTAVYRYIVGFIFATSSAFKTALFFALKHSTEILMVIALISTVIVTQLFEANAISFAVCIFLIAIIIAWILTLIKIKILESKRGEK